MSAKCVNVNVNVNVQFFINGTRHQFTDGDRVASHRIQFGQHQWVPEYVSGVECQQFPLRAFNNHSAPAPLQVHHFPLQLHSSLTDLRTHRASKVFQYV